MLVLEKGKLGFDGDVDEGIEFLHYDDETTTRRPTTDEGFGADDLTPARLTIGTPPRARRRWRAFGRASET